MNSLGYAQLKLLVFPPKNLEKSKINSQMNYLEGLKLMFFLNIFPNDFPEYNVIVLNNF